MESETTKGIALLEINSFEPESVQRIKYIFAKAIDQLEVEGISRSEPDEKVAHKKVIDKILEASFWASRYLKGN